MSLGNAKLVLIKEDLVQLKWMLPGSADTELRHFVRAVPDGEEKVGEVLIYVWDLRLKENQKPTHAGCAEKGALETWLK